MKLGRSLLIGCWGSLATGIDSVTIEGGWNWLHWGELLHVPLWTGWGILFGTRLGLSFDPFPWLIWLLDSDSKSLSNAEKLCLLDFLAFLKLTHDPPLLSDKLKSYS